jgi:hypothetical protein
MGHPAPCWTLDLWVCAFPPFAEGAKMGHGVLVVSAEL